MMKLVKAAGNALLIMLSVAASVSFLFLVIGLLSSWLSPLLSLATFLTIAIFVALTFGLYNERL